LTAGWRGDLDTPDGHDVDRNKTMMNRRHWLEHAGLASLALGAWPLAGAAAPGSGDHGADPRLVLIVLRGGLDGLFAVPALGDPQFSGARGALAQYEQPPLPLDALFSLHPALTNWHQLYLQKQLVVAHAVGLPYQQRSHFDAQNVLDTGSARPFEAKDGWLNRAVALWAAGRRSARGAGEPQAVALTATIPLLLQGPAAVSNWSGAHLGDVSGDTLDRLARLYAGDAALASSLARARMAMETTTGDDNPPAAAMPGDGKKTAARPAAGATGLAGAAAQAAQFLAAPLGPRVAVLEAGGWDSHINQATPQGQLMRNLAALDQAILKLQSGLGAAWQRTVVMVVTEFGRTVHANGTGGTDHGVGMAALLAGGAVRGGRVLSDWPGLGAAALLDGRDLRPTADVRGLFKGVLAEHLGLPAQALESQVFPGSGAVKPWEGLVRAA
jgi:uncharacterized protein (DUF1501 family)